ncbi:hypothetical protein DH86_00002415, partial [Scytalidium sp. 3C]
YKVAIVRTCTGGVDSDFPFTKENPDFLPFKLLAVMEAEKIIDPEPAAHISENDSTQSTVDMPLETGQAVGSEPITPAPYARTDGDDGYVQGFRLLKLTLIQYVFISFLLLFELGSLLCGVATSSRMLIVGRAVAGLGGSGMINGALTILSSAIPLQKRACFYINLPLGGTMAAILLLLHIPDHAAKYSVLKSLDLVGFALFAPAAVQLLLAVQWGHVTYPWNSAHIIGLFCGAGGVFLIFLAWEYHQGDTAMIPLAMISKRVVWSASCSMGFFFASMLTFSYYLPIYFQAVKGAQPTLSGVYMLPGIISQMIFSILSGVLVNRTGYYLPGTIFYGIMQAISAGLISTFTPHTSTGKWIGYQIIGGVGRGLGMQMVSNASVRR